MKKVVLIERPVLAPFDDGMRARLEQILKARIRESPVPVTARWHKSAPVLRIETKFVCWDVTFGPELFKVEAVLSTLGLFLNTKKSRDEACAFIEKIAEEVGI